MFERLRDWMENRLAPAATRFAEQRHMRAVRDGLMATLPFIVTGSLFLLIACLPITGWEDLIAPIQGKLFTGFTVTFGLASLYATFMIGHQLALSYGINGPFSGLLSIMSLIMLNPPGEGGIDVGNLGPGGLFVGILAAVVAVEIYRFLVKRNIVIKMPKGVPPAVSASFSALLPAFVIACLLWFIRLVLNIEPYSMINTVLRPLVFAADTFPGIMLYMLMWNLPWVVGIHGMVVASAADPMWIAFLGENAAAIQAGLAAPHIANKMFFEVFCMIGGSGCTLALVYFLLRARSSRLRTVGKVELLPALFNINEPIIFGMPVVLNPIMAIPFLLAPMCAAAVNYGAMSIGLVPKAFLMVPWALPNPLACYLATGGDFRALMLSFVNLAVTGAVWYPFFKVYDNQLYADEKKNAA